MNRERKNPDHFSVDGQMAETRMIIRKHTGHILLASALVYSLGVNLLNSLKEKSSDSGLVSDSSARELEDKEREIQMLRLQIEQLRLSGGQVDSGLESCQCDGPSEMEMIYKCDRAPIYSYATVDERKR